MALSNPSLAFIISVIIRAMYSRLIITLIISAALLLTGDIASAKDIEGVAIPVYAVWDGQDFEHDGLYSLSGMGLRGIFVSTVFIDFGSREGGLEIATQELGDLPRFGFEGREFYIVVQLTAPLENRDELLDAQTLAYMLGDLCINSATEVQKIGADVVGIVLRPIHGVGLSEIAQIIAALRSHPAFITMPGIETFGAYIDKSQLDDDNLPKLAEAADLLVVDLLEFPFENGSVELVGKKETIKVAKRLESLGAPFMISFPMREYVSFQSGDGGRIDVPESLSFDEIAGMADIVESDSYGNQVARFVHDELMGDIEVKSGSWFTMISPDPILYGEISLILNKRNYKNLIGLALDSFPFESSEFSGTSTAYIQALSMREITSTTGPPPIDPDLLKFMEEGRKAQIVVYYFIAIFILVAGVLTGFSLLKKRNLVYDEESDKLIRRDEEKK